MGPRRLGVPGVVMRIGAVTNEIGVEGVEGAPPAVTAAALR
jgi:hypothetical protein